MHSFIPIGLPLASVRNCCTNSSSANGVSHSGLTAGDTQSSPFLMPRMSAISSIIEATLSRIRPVMLAAITTILGMAPLLFDRFFADMAVTIMGA